MLQAQYVFEDWVAKTGNQDFYYYGTSATDAAQNVYQVGATFNVDGNYDAIVTKFDRLGAEVWTKTFDGPTEGDDTFTDIVLDGSAVLITGTSRNISQTAAEVFTVKLATATGNTTWSDRHTYSGSLYNVGASITYDGSGNVYVAGVSYNLTTLSDVLAIKYNSLGVMQWDTTEDINGMEDVSGKIVYKSGSLTLTGGSQQSNNTWRYLVVKVASSTGVVSSTAVGSNNVTSIDQVSDALLDSDGNLYVTGFAGTVSEGYNMYTMKLDEDLNIVWDDSYNLSGSGDDRAYGIALDNSDNVIVTGCSDLGSGNNQFTTLKYSNAGSFQWAKHYDVSTGPDTAKAVITDDSDNIYITGSFYNGSNQDVKTIKYNSSGAQQWEIDYNGAANGDEYVMDITYDGEAVIVTTQTYVSNNYAYEAIRYQESNYDELSFTPTESAFSNSFIRNQGQLRDTSGTAHSDVKYYSKVGSYAGFYQDDAIEWMTRTFHNDSTMADTIQKVKLAFVSPELNCRVTPIERSNYFENHYQPFGLKAYERIPFYEKLVYPEVWDKIALETAYVNGQELRFTIGKDGRPELIKLDVSGADSVRKNTDGTISLYTFNGAFTIPKAKAYQENGSGVLTELGWSPALKLTGNQISFDSIGAYNAGKDLVLRLTRGGGGITQSEGFCHSTYFGGPQVSIDDGSSNSNGDPIFCGTSSNSEFYFGFQEYIQHGTQAGISSFIAKFDRDMIPKFATVIHGQSSEAGAELWLSSIASDDNNDIYSAGRVYRLNNLYTNNDVGSSNFEDQPFGGRDGYLIKANGINGAITYATHFGGASISQNLAGHDYINDMAFDSNNNLYIVGSTKSNDANGFPFTEMDGAHNDNGGPGGFIARFNEDLDLEWCTRFGTEDESISKIAVNIDDDIAIAGRSESTVSFIPTFAGTTQDLTPNGIDWFISMFNENGELEWGTFEGSDDDDRRIGCDLVFDTDKSLYFGANVFSTSGINFVDPAGTSYFNNTNSGASNPSASMNNYGLLVHYSATTFTADWRTLIMDGEDLNRINSLELRNNNLYVSGTTTDGSMSLVQADVNLFSRVKTTAPTGINLEGFIMTFNTGNKELTHSTYFGGHKDDEHKALSINNDLEVFGFGFTKSRYGLDLLGIPVQDNEVNGRWYDDREEFVTEYINVGYVFKWCLSGTPLTTNDKFEANEDKAFIIYPCPLKSGFGGMDFRIKSDIQEIETLTISDIMGKIIYVQPSVQFTGDISQQISLPSSIGSGVYIVTLNTKGNAYSQKLLVVE